MLTPELSNQINSIDYTRFLPMGQARFSAAAYRKAMDPRGLKAAWQSVENEARASEAAFRQQMMRLRRAHAAAFQKRAAFNTRQPVIKDQGLIQKFLSNKYAK